VQGRERVAVIGSARLDEQDPAWATGFELGRLLARAGFAVVTGGYGGLMSAVSRGAREADGHVVGLPMRAWAHLTPNEWNVELRWAADYPARLSAILECRALVALDGGVGTLSELSVVWAAAQTEEGMPRIVAIGDPWRRILDALALHLVVGPEDLALVRVVHTPEDALSAIMEPPGPERPGPRG
jgi:uncharacterized protein (TIGR00725 family)